MSLDALSIIYFPIDSELPRPTSIEVNIFFPKGIKSSLIFLQKETYLDFLIVNFLQIITAWQHFLINENPVNFVIRYIKAHSKNICLVQLLSNSEQVGSSKLYLYCFWTFLMWFKITLSQNTFKSQRGLYFKCFRGWKSSYIRKILTDDTMDPVLLFSLYFPELFHINIDMGETIQQTSEW